MDNHYAFEEEYRDTIATVDASGRRVWVYPKKPKGYYHNLRVIVTIVLLSLLFSGPFVKVSGQPLLLLNFFERKFIIFGQTFWPQDFFLLALLLIIFFVFIILFTVAFGRIWCGWACPQTLFMEMVFRKIEYWIEGDGNQQRRLNQAPWTGSKIFKKGFKHFIFLVIAILIAHTVMAYLIGIDEVKIIMSKSPSEHLAGFIGLVSFTGIFYWVFAFFREQACVSVCPYGRLQSVLLVKNSIVVIYDWLRGEPRGKIHKNKQDTSKGDCIDCKLCVHVCPTGIDIRNGTQLECVNCTACMDACDDVMSKIGKPEGLIRYSSHTAIEESHSKLFTPRIAAYSMILVALAAFLSFMLVSRSEIDITVLKVPGTLYEKTEDGQISNLYKIQLINKTFDQMNIYMSVDGIDGATINKVGESDVTVPANGKFEGIFFITVPAKSLEQAKSKISIGIYRDAELLDSHTTGFLGPIKLKNTK